MVMTFGQAFSQAITYLEEVRTTVGDITPKNVYDIATRLWNNAGCFLIVQPGADPVDKLDLIEELAWEFSV